MKNVETMMKEGNKMQKLRKWEVDILFT